MTATAATQHRCPAWLLTSALRCCAALTRIFWLRFSSFEYTRNLRLTTPHSVQNAHSLWLFSCRKINKLTLRLFSLSFKLTSHSSLRSECSLSLRMFVYYYCLNIKSFLACLFDPNFRRFAICLTRPRPGKIFAIDLNIVWGEIMMRMMRLKWR